VYFLAYEPALVSSEHLTGGSQRPSDPAQVRVAQWGASTAGRKPNDRSEGKDWV